MLRIAVCDDDQISLEKICDNTEQFFKLHHIYVEIYGFTSANAMLEKDCSLYDIFLLDVRMDTIDGLAAGKQVRRKNPQGIIVYISEIIDYAPMAYEVRAFRYLLKSNLSESLPRCLVEILEELQSRKATYPIKTDLGNYYVPVKDILYIESRKRVLVFHLTDDTNAIRNEFVCYGKLSDLEQNLSPFGFILLQRGCLVNMDKILFFRKTQVTLKNGVVIAVSEKNCREIVRQYNLWKGVVGWKK